VTNLVLESGDIKSRAQAIMFVVSIAMQCKEMQNFNTLTALIAGLTMGPVYRLQKTWSLFREKHQKYASAYDEISDIVSARGQYANYRRTLKQCEPPVIPFLGVYLTDLTFIELGNPNFLPESGFINLGKHSKTARIIREMHSYQRESFKFAPVPELKKFFRALNKRKWRDEKQLYQQSFAVEPKEIESDDDSSGDEA
jgi:hypothetical protein